MVVIKTGMSELPQVCEECRYYGVRPHPYDGWMDMCDEHYDNIKFAVEMYMRANRDEIGTIE